MPVIGCKTKKRVQLLCIPGHRPICNWVFKSNGNSSTVYVGQNPVAVIMSYNDRGKGHLDLFSVIGEPNKGYLKENT